MENSPKLDLTHSDAEYWNERWIKNQTEFHKTRIHPMLQKHLELLTSKSSSKRIFVPLCGKTLDIVWLASLGYSVIGVEFAELAVKQFFDENNIKYHVKEIDNFKIYTSEDNQIKIYNGDFFKFDGNLESKFECIWDRGSLTALPPDLRKKYAPVILDLLHPEFYYLLDLYQYDASLYPGPPHSVLFKEVQNLFEKECKIEEIDSIEARAFNEQLINEKSPKEVVYYLTRNS